MITAIAVINLLTLFIFLASFPLHKFLKAYIKNYNEDKEFYLFVVQSCSIILYIVLTIIQNLKILL